MRVASHEREVLSSELSYSRDGNTYRLLCIHSYTMLLYSGSQQHYSLFNIICKWMYISH